MSPNKIRHLGRTVMARTGGLSVAKFITLLLAPVIYAIFVSELKLVKWETMEETKEVAQAAVLLS